MPRGRPKIHVDGVYRARGTGAWNYPSRYEYLFINCKHCDTPIPNVSEHTKSAVCWKCVSLGGEKDFEL